MGGKGGSILCRHGPEARQTGGKTEPRPFTHLCNCILLRTLDFCLSSFPVILAAVGMAAEVSAQLASQAKNQGWGLSITQSFPFTPFNFPPLPTLRCPAVRTATSSTSRPKRCGLTPSPSMPCSPSSVARYARSSWWAGLTSTSTSATSTTWCPSVWRNYYWW